MVRSHGCSIAKWTYGRSHGRPKSQPVWKMKHLENILEITKIVFKRWCLNSRMIKRTRYCKKFRLAETLASKALKTRGLQAQVMLR